MNAINNEQDDLKAARKMHVRAMQSGQPSDYLLAADLFEKCGRYDDARACRDAADKIWTPEEILKREG
jgi:hypothetical protein